MPGAGLEPA